MDILAKQSLTGNISGKERLVGDIAISDTAAVRPDTYEGSYEIKPTTESQILQTKEKLMKDDLTVKAIPYAEVTNSSNGITVTIGE